MLQNQLSRIICLILSVFSSGLFASAQNKIITGKVTDIDNRSPLANVSIISDETKTGTQTNVNGSFRLVVPVSVKKLSISAIDYLPQEIDVSVFSSIDVALVSRYSTLSDVVVIGYGTSKRKDLTGSVASVSEKDFNKGNFTSPDQLIQGKVPGVQITANDGSPGGAITLRIRGNSALTGTGQPLYVVDGIPLDGRSVQPDNNPLNFLNPIDIASITAMCLHNIIA